MDLNPAAGNGPDTYATFADLYRYCYLVASVVGLVCIRIFGYQDPRAVKLAEETGIAFQLTNILRDVAEDAERNRVYLPLDDLAAHNVSLDALLHRAPGNAAHCRRTRIAGRCRSARRELLSLRTGVVAPESIVKAGLLSGCWSRSTMDCSSALARADYDVFSSRASMPSFEKLGILAVGLTRMFWARLFA